MRLEFSKDRNIKFFTPFSPIEIIFGEEGKEQDKSLVIKRKKQGIFAYLNGKMVFHVLNNGRYEGVDEDNRVTGCDNK